MKRKINKANRNKKIVISAVAMLAVGAIVVAVVLIVSARPSVRVNGFALVEERGDERVYVSPEGFYCRFHAEENYPAKDLSFWRDALSNKMDVCGYTRLFEESPGAAGPAICYLEWGAPYGSEDYVYATALSVKGNRLYIGEAAGELSMFQAYRAPIMSAFREMVR
jgi:hypothetical protein